MTNPHKGDVELQAGEECYTLRFDIDAIAKLEAKAGELDGLRRKGFQKIATEMSDPETMSISLLRVVLWASLQKHHPEIGIVQAGELIPQAGGMGSVLQKINLAFEFAFPQAVATDDGEGARPQMPGQNGTGSASSTPGLN